MAVAQNLRESDGMVTNMSEGNARGRSFHKGKKDTSPGAVERGYNFQEQWDRALKLDPPFVMVTGWNEWTAGHFSRPGAAGRFRRSVRPGIQPRHRAGEGVAQRQLLLPVGRQRPPLQRRPGYPQSVGPAGPSTSPPGSASGGTSAPHSRITPSITTTATSAPARCTTPTPAAATIWSS